MDKKIISFSLWGNNKKYTIGAIKNIVLARKFYPGWICRFYVSDCVPQLIIEELKLLGAEIVEMGVGGWHSLFWRFHVASDPSISAGIIRDSDSRLSFRESQAVSEWLMSNKSYHVMRDHPNHPIPILGGMWGFKKSGIISNMIELIESYKNKGSWGTDQNFLQDIILPKIKDNIFIHDPVFDKKPFSTDRTSEYDFIGEIFDENDNPVPEHREKLKNCYELNKPKKSNLSELGKIIGTDKWDNFHSFNNKSYLDIYQTYFQPLKDNELNILELGVLNGQSHRLWRDYFPKSNIYGLDINPSAKFSEERINIFIGNQTDETIVSEICETAKKFDIVIDDASHVNDMSIKSFELIFPYLNNGGLYIIEDLRQSYHEDILDQSFTWPGMHLVRATGAELINRRKDMNFFFFEKIKNMDFLRGEIQYIHFYPMTVVIKKID